MLVSKDTTGRAQGNTLELPPDLHPMVETKKIDFTADPEVAVSSLEEKNHKVGCDAII